MSPLTARHPGALYMGWVGLGCGWVGHSWGPGPVWHVLCSSM